MTNGIKKEIEELLLYEIEMLRETYKEISLLKVSQFQFNLLIESFVLHARVLIDFFYSERKYKDDVIAQDLLPSTILWADFRPVLSTTLKEAKKKADKQLAHLSLDRINLKNNNKHGWRFQEINQEIEDIIQCFYDIRK